MEEKRSFRAGTARPTPSYPTLETFDAGRRRFDAGRGRRAFLELLGGSLLGGAILALAGDAWAGEHTGKKGKGEDPKDPKKPKKPKKPKTPKKPPPPKMGIAPAPRARSDGELEGSTAEPLGQKQPEDPKKKGKGKQGKGKPPKPKYPRRTAGVPPRRRARLDELEGLED